VSDKLLAEERKKEEEETEQTQYVSQRITSENHTRIKIIYGSHGLLEILPLLKITMLCPW
jgi:hypothetical protein